MIKNIPKGGWRDFQLIAYNAKLYRKKPKTLCFSWIFDVKPCGGWRDKKWQGEAVLKVEKNRSITTFFLVCIILVCEKVRPSTIALLELYIGGEVLFLSIYCVCVVFYALHRVQVPSSAPEERISDGGFALCNIAGKLLQIKSTAKCRTQKFVCVG